MTTAGEIFENAMLHWRDNAGIGTALIPAPLNDKLMALGILQRVYARSPTCKTVIAVDSFSERIKFIEFITNQGDEENDTEFKALVRNGNIKVLTYDFIIKYPSIEPPFLLIYYCPTAFDSSLNNILSRSRFRLVIINKLLQSKEDMNRLYSSCPLLPDFKQNEVEAIRLSAPVEETQIGVTIPEDSEAYKLLNYCNEYVSTSIAIFGSFDIMQQARLGNSQLNISSAQICAQIASENGWNEHLDMTIDFNVQIDRLYNPGSLRDRATQTYEEIRKRSNLLSDYTAKLEEILDIVQSNPDKKILIINKRAEFATIVTDYLNNLAESNICGNYHDKVEPIPAVNVDGSPIYFKSGPHKGERRMMAAQAQKSFNESAFNRGDIRVLSTSNSPDKDLCIDVDIVIITSPQCESIKTYMYRLTKVSFNDGIKLYTIYCKDTTEEKLLENKLLPDNYKLLNNSKKCIVSENNYDCIVVD